MKDLVPNIHDLIYLLKEGLIDIDKLLKTNVILDHNNRLILRILSNKDNLKYKYNIKFEYMNIDMCKILVEENIFTPDEILQKYLDNIDLYYDKNTTGYLIVKIGISKLNNRLQFSKNHRAIRFINEIILDQV